MATILLPPPALLLAPALLPLPLPPKLQQTPFMARRSSWAASYLWEEYPFSFAWTHVIQGPSKLLPQTSASKKMKPFLPSSALPRDPVVEPVCGFDVAPLLLSSIHGLGPPPSPSPVVRPGSEGACCSLRAGGHRKPAHPSGAPSKAPGHCPVWREPFCGLTSCLRKDQIHT